MLTLLCSGQGTQHRDMFRLTGGAAEAAAIFAAAREALDDEDPRELVRSASEERLRDNRVAQVLCCTQALAAHACLAPHLPPRRILAGYSVGELAAWGCAGLIEPSRVPALAVLRARLMDAASGPGFGLAAIRGLPRGAVDELCGRHRSEIAIVNPGDLFVLGGPRRDLDALCAEAIERGAARATPLAVSTPSHTPTLEAAVGPLQMALQSALDGRRVPPGVRLVSGRDGSLVRGIAADFERLSAQIASRLDWAAALQACIELGASRVLELGPGHALADMVRDATSGLEARSLEEFASLDGARNWIRAQAT